MDFEYRITQYKASQVHVPIPPYKYSPLNADAEEIRLVEVLPGPLDAPIQCKLHHYSLETVPFYAALSYEWGDPSVWNTVYVDGIEFPITTNLESVLHRLRTRGCPLLFIDAICIHQADNEEKNKQVPLMKQIYHQADSVIVWLGDDADGSEDVMQMMRGLEISRRPAEVHKRPPWSPDLRHMKDIEEKLKTFIYRSYWSRIWIIQEIVLSSKATIFCGDTIVAWKAMELLVAEIDRHGLLQQEASLARVRRLCSGRITRAQAKPLSLLQALYDNSSSLATDPRDKVYGLLGLTFDSDYYVRKLHYGWSEEDICHNITQTVIRSKKQLDIIVIGNENPESNLPSWCPDFLNCREGAVYSSLLGYLSGQIEGFRAGQRGTRWHTTSDSLATRDVMKLADKRYLIIKAVRVGKINGLGCTMSDQPDTKPQHVPKSDGQGSPERQAQVDPDRVYSDMNRALLLYDSTYAYSMSGFDKRCTPLYYYLYTFDDYKQLIGIWERKHLRRKYEKVRDWRDRNKDFIMPCGKTFKARATGFRAAMNSGRAGATTADVATALVGGVGVGAAVAAGPAGAFLAFPIAYAAGANLTEGVPSTLDAALMQLETLIEEGLRLMTAEDNRIGWAHPDSQIGDEIYLLLGCSLPVILRPVADKGANTFKIVGHAYVEGIMNGELWARLDQDEMEAIRLV